LYAADGAGSGARENTEEKVAGRGTRYGRWREGAYPVADLGNELERIYNNQIKGVRHHGRQGGGHGPERRASIAVIGGKGGGERGMGIRACSGTKGMEAIFKQTTSKHKERPTPWWRKRSLLESVQSTLCIVMFATGPKEGKRLCTELSNHHSAGVNSAKEEVYPTIS